MKSILTVIGTRPEAIKLAPFLAALKEKLSLRSEVCITRQHTDLLDPFLAALGIQVDYAFTDAEEASSLHQRAGHILAQFGELFATTKPDVVVVQGDTTTAFIAALAAFYASIPVAHVEAGLRTGCLRSPWPEEGHRNLIGCLATYSFAPTIEAQDALLEEGVPSGNIWVVGNTAIDALRILREKPREATYPGERVILVTVHRRENHGKPLEQICLALCQIIDEYPDVRILFFLHPNPAVRGPCKEMLSGLRNIDLLEPADHPTFIALMDESAFIITDSGGIQEEAPFLGKPVLVVRNTTERPEGVLAGTAQLIGTQTETILAASRQLLSDSEALATRSKAHFPYGDGYAATRIADVLEEKLVAVP